MLNEKTAVVTGASRGIGRSIALDLAKNGANVVVNYSGAEAKANEVVDEIKSMGRKAIAVKADVSNPEDVQNMIKEAISVFSTVDILVNNAGITKDNLIMRMKEDEWDDVININLKGVFNCTKAVTRQMMKQTVQAELLTYHLLSASAEILDKPTTWYAKAGVIGLTKSSAKELASRNITVNAIAPGFISTDMTDKLAKDVQDEMLKQIPLARFGDPGDVSGVVTFLASEGARYMTGQTLHIDGGMVM